MHESPGVVAPADAPGFGLVLYFDRTLVVRTGGTISVESAPLGGSVLVEEVPTSAHAVSATRKAQTSRRSAFGRSETA